MNWEALLGLLGGGLGVFILKLYGDWRNAKRGATKNEAGAWQQIADRESKRYETLEARVTRLEKVVLEQNVYIKQLEHVIIAAGLTLPVRIESQ